MSYRKIVHFVRTQIQIKVKESITSNQLIFDHIQEPIEGNSGSEFDL